MPIYMDRHQGEHLSAQAVAEAHAAEATCDDGVDNEGDGLTERMLRFLPDRHRDRTFVFHVPTGREQHRDRLRSRTVARSSRSFSGWTALPEREFDHPQFR